MNPKSIQKLVTFGLILLSFCSLYAQMKTLAPMVTQLPLTLNIIEIKIKDDRDVDNDGEFHFWRKMNGIDVRLPTTGEIVRKKDEFIRPGDPNLGQEPFWQISWQESGTESKLIKFDGYEYDSLDDDDYLDVVSIELDFSSLKFVTENTNRIIENANYQIRYNIVCSPQIQSDTHPDSNLVYEKGALRLQWEPVLPAFGILGYSYTLDENPSTEPDELPEGTHTSRAYILEYIGDREYTYWFRIKAKDKMGFWSNTGHFRVNTGPYQLFLKSTETALTQNGIPDRFEVRSNYPNPFNNSTQIQFQLPTTGQVVLNIYNLLGQPVQQSDMLPPSGGIFTFQWDGKNQSGNDVPSGVYWARLCWKDQTKTIKMTLLR